MFPAKLYTVNKDIYTTDLNNILDMKFFNGDIYVIGYCILTNIRLYSKNDFDLDNEVLDPKILNEVTQK